MQLDTQQLLKRYATPTVRSERDELIARFVAHGSINIRDRKTKELKPATAKDIAMLLLHVPTTDLYPFYKSCLNARSFSRFFWWSIKTH